MTMGRDSSFLYQLSAFEQEHASPQALAGLTVTDFIGPTSQISRILCKLKCVTILMANPRSCLHISETMFIAMSS